MSNIDHLVLNGVSYGLTDTDLGTEVSTLESALDSETIFYENVDKSRRPGEYGFLRMSDYTFTQNSISAETGKLFPMNNRIASEFIYIDNVRRIEVTPESGYKYSISEYDRGGNYIRSTSWYSSDNWHLINSASPMLIRFLIAHVDDSNISISEGASSLDSVKLYWYDLSSLNQMRQNGIENEQVLQFTYATEDDHDTRAASEFLIYDDLYIDKFGTLGLNIGVNVYDAGYNYLATYAYTEATSIYMHKSDQPNGKYMQVYLQNLDSSTPLNEEDVKTANTVFRVNRYCSYDTDYLTLQNIKINQNNFIHDHFYRDYTLNGRIITRGFFNNLGHIITNQDVDYRMYVRYYDSNFEYVSDTEWDTRFIDTSLSDAPYFRLVVEKISSQTPLTEDQVQRIIDSIDLDGIMLPNTTISGVDGSLNFNVGAIRCAVPKFKFIHDAYIKIKNIGYDVAVALYDTDESYLSDMGWYTYSTEYGAPDKAFRLQNCCVRFSIAKQDRTASISFSERVALQKAIKNGELIEIVECVDPHSFGYQTIHGNPLYYKDETKNTVDTMCSAITKDSTVFAMITDLHDNDPYHYSETLDYQISAIKDLKERLRIDFILVGGDLTDGGWSNKSKLLDKFTDHAQRFSKVGCPVLYMRGNHDENSYYSHKANNCVSGSEFASRLILKEASNVVQNGKAYYYHDFEDVNVRVIVLDFIDYPWQVDSEGDLVYYAAGGDGVWRGYSNDQIAWLAGTALDTNKNIVVTSHYSTHTNLMSSWEKSVEHNWESVSQAMIAYQSRGTFTFNGQTYNYANKTGKIFAQVTGHSHSFGAFVDSGVVWSTTGSPSTEVTHRTYDDTPYETMGSRAYGDITEAHFNIFVCDSGHVHIISFGQMGDLNFSI